MCVANAEVGDTIVTALDQYVVGDVEVHNGHRLYYPAGAGDHTYAVPHENVIEVRPKAAG